MAFRIAMPLFIHWYDIAPIPSSSVKLFDAVNACPLLTVPVIVTLQAVLKGLESNGVTINYNTNNKYKSLKQIRAIVKGDKQ